MSELDRGRVRATRTSVLFGVLVLLSAVLVSSSQTGIGLGRTHSQDLYVPPPAVSLNPDNLDFGKQVVGRASAAKRITVKNSGGKPLYIESVDLGGDNPNSFAMIKDTCTGATIDPERACIVDVTFTPTRTGGRNARLKLNNNAPSSPQRLRLKGEGLNSIDVPPF